MSKKDDVPTRERLVYVDRKEDVPPSCGYCVFAGKHAQDDSLRYCRHKSPAGINSSGHGIFPVVRIDTDWCGDFVSE